MTLSPWVILPIYLMRAYVHVYYTCTVSVDWANLAHANDLNRKIRMSSPLRKRHIYNSNKTPTYQRGFVQLRRVGFILLSFVLTGAVLAQDSRTITDPNSISSTRNPTAKPINIQSLPLPDNYSLDVFQPAWSPDEKEIVYSSNIGGQLNLWKMSTPGRTQLQLSHENKRQLQPQWSPDGSELVFEQDEGGGSGLYDLILMSRDGAKVTNLTNTPDIAEFNPHWAPNGKQIAFNPRSKFSSTTNLAVYDCLSRTSHLLTDEHVQGITWGPAFWSRDGRFVFSTRGNIDKTDSDIYRIEPATGTIENLTPHSGNIQYDLGDVMADGSTALVSSNIKNGVSNIGLLDVASKKLTWITDSNWEATPSHFSPDGKLFTYMMNVDGRSELYIGNRATLKVRRLNFPGGVLSPLHGIVLIFSASGDRLLAQHEGSQSPPNLWIYNIKTDKAEQITHFRPDLSAKVLPASHLVHYRSFDGTLISAFVWLPFNLNRDHSNPGVVLAHPGPNSQAIDAFNATASALASRGYVCIAPNPRGSTGYGLSFLKANYQDLGGRDLQDEIYAARFLTSTGYVDRKRIGITGVSYGGFMTMMAIGKSPSVWAAGVEGFGIFNWYSMLQHEDPLFREYEKSLLGDPIKDRGIYEQDSPMKYILNSQAPLLVLQGENDFQVPKEEAEQVVSILQKAGKTVAVHYYPNEGHGLVNHQVAVDALERTIDWFDRYLKKTSNQNAAMSFERLRDLSPGIDGMPSM